MIAATHHRRGIGICVALTSGLFVCVVAAAVLATQALDQDTAQSSAKLVLRQASFDAGRRTAGDKFFARITLRNAGGQRLIIRQDSDVCPCCEEKWADSLKVPERASVVLEFLVVTPDEPGEFQQTRQFLTNDPLRPNLVVTAHGYVVPRPTTRSL